MSPSTIGSRCVRAFVLPTRSGRATTCKRVYSRDRQRATAVSASSCPAVKAIDVEYAHFRHHDRVQTAAAEVCVVSEDGNVTLEGFVFPDLGRQEDAQWFGGVRPEQFRTGSSPTAMHDLVEHELAGCMLVGYGLSKDLRSLHVGHPLAMQRELMACRKFQAGHGGQAQKLQVLALKYLGSHIQNAHHSAREDAQAVMQLYLQHVKVDPAQMSYEDLVQLETKQLMQCVADMRPPS